ncbi:hypothetical protein C4D60_Mb08t27340 [Musa balbisiana]|uniref:Uncharacterized protein n=1 Tax=Musa balbisiana TaxID=52838 RepID=A0A4S8K6Y5_MUSBA|nr:hypothetical protein C4D60_Mb08t27340 [Musa balbisiana]
MESPAPSSRLARCMASPSWFPLQRGHSRFHLLRRTVGLERSRSWRNLLKRLLKEGRSMYGSKQLNFGYDADSYSKNFDDGRWNERSDRFLEDRLWQLKAR